MSNRYYQYLDTLYTNYEIITRLEWLSNDDSVLFDITNDVIQGGSYTVTFQDGMRRAGNVTVENWANKYDVNVNKIWFGQKIRLLQGVRLPDGSEYLIQQGIFYISNPSVVFNPSERNVNLQLVDKWGFLDGTLFGNLPGIYQLAIGDNLFTAIQQLLLTDRGNGIPIDSSVPILSSYYKDKTVVIDGTTYSVLQCPYTARINIGQTFADVLLEINTMLVSTIGYDPFGRLTLIPTQTDIKDSIKEILWNFTTKKSEFFGMSSTSKMTDVYNEVIVVGGTLNGAIAKGIAQNTDIRSDTCIQRIGKKTLCKSESKYYANSQCQELSDYTLLRSKILQSSIEMRCAPMFHFRENAIITIFRDGIDSEPKPYLLNSYTNQMAPTGEMSCNVTSINELI